MNLFRHNSLIQNIQLCIWIYALLFFCLIVFIKDPLDNVLSYLPIVIANMIRNTLGEINLLYALPFSFGGKLTVGFLFISLFLLIINFIDTFSDLGETEHPISGAVFLFWIFLVITLNPNSFNDLIIYCVFTGYYILPTIGALALGEMIFDKFFR